MLKSINIAILNELLNDENLKKLEYLKNQYVLNIIEKYITLLKPEKITVITDAKEDIKYVKKMAIERGEERPILLNKYDTGVISMPYLLRIAYSSINKE